MLNTKEKLANHSGTFMPHKHIPNNKSMNTKRMILSVTPTFLFISLIYASNVKPLLPHTDDECHKYD